MLARVFPPVVLSNHPLRVRLVQAPRAGARLVRGIALGLWALRRMLLPAPYVQAFREVTRMLIRNRTLALEMARRDVRGEHAGAIFGSAWGIAQPLFLMALYAFVFGVVFRVRIGDTFELPRNYTVYILAGLVPWLALAQAMGAGVGAITGSVQLVKQSVFTLEILPTTRALAALLPLLVGVVFVVVYVLVDELRLPWTYALVPLLAAVQLVAMTGLSFALSAVGVFVRDVKEAIAILTLLGIFVLPIVYLPDGVPELFRPVLYVNPASYMIWCWQDALYYGRIDHPWAWPVFVLGSLFLFTAGYRLFRRLRPYFGNVL